MTCTAWIGAVPQLMLLKPSLAIWQLRTLVVVCGSWEKGIAVRDQHVVMLSVVPLYAHRTA